MNNTVVKLFGLLFVMMISMAENMDVYMYEKVEFLNIFWTAVYSICLIWFLKSTSRFIKTDKWSSRIYNVVWIYYIVGTLLSLMLFIGLVDLSPLNLEKIVYVPFAGLMNIVYSLQNVFKAEADFLVFGICCLIMSLLGYLFKKKDFNTEQKNV